METDVTLKAKATCVVQDLGGGVFLVDGAMVPGAAKMLSAVSAALGIQPKPRVAKVKAVKKA